MNQPPKPAVVRNRRLKMSPGGIVSLPVSARKALSMEKGEGRRVTVAIKDGAVVLAPAVSTGGFRVSPKGQLELRGDARALLAKGTKGHYWVDLDDNSGTVRLHPFA